MALRDAIARGDSPKALHELALDVIAETGNFKALRDQAGAAKVAEALQTARERLIKEVQSEIARALEQKYPGIEVEFVNLGTPGFHSDMDYTINVRPGKASVNDAIAASVEGVRAAYDVFGGEKGSAVGDGFDGARKKIGDRRLPPDRVLDSNFYTELHEHAIAPRTAEERLAISGDQSVVSLAEARMNMDPAEWPAYRERMLSSFEDTGADHTGTEADINALARQRLRGQLDAAERLVAELHPPGKTREQVLAGAQQELLDAIDSGASPREVRALQAKIKLLEPDAYGTRAAKVGVVDQYQGAARAKTRREAWDALGQGKDAAMAPRERAADAAQKGAASAAKLRHAAPDAGATTAQVISATKYLARVYEAFRDAGLHVDHPLIGAPATSSAPSRARGRRRGDGRAPTLGAGHASPRPQGPAAAPGRVRQGGQAARRRARPAAAAQRGDHGRHGSDGPRAGGSRRAPRCRRGRAGDPARRLLRRRRRASPAPTDGSAFRRQGSAFRRQGPAPSSPSPAPVPAPATPRRGPGGFDSAAEAGHAVARRWPSWSVAWGRAGRRRTSSARCSSSPTRRTRPRERQAAQAAADRRARAAQPGALRARDRRASERAVLTGTDINGALLQMAKEGA